MQVRYRRKEGSAIPDCVVCDQEATCSVRFDRHTAGPFPPCSRPPGFSSPCIRPKAAGKAGEPQPFFLPVSGAKQVTRAPISKERMGCARSHPLLPPARSWPFGTYFSRWVKRAALIGKETGPKKTGKGTPAGWTWPKLPGRAMPECGPSAGQAVGGREKNGPPGEGGPLDKGGYANDGKKQTGNAFPL